MTHNAMYELFYGDFYEALRKVRFYSFWLTDIGDRPVDRENIIGLKETIVNLCNSAEMLVTARDKALADLTEIENQMDNPVKE